MYGIVRVSVIVSRSVVPDSLRPHGLQHTRLLCPWDFPGKDTGVGCHFLLQNYKCMVWVYSFQRASLVAQSVKNLPVVQETRVQSLGWEDPLEREMATHSSILAWKISWTKEPRGLQYMELQRVRHDWATNTNTKDPICHNKDWRFLIPHNWHNQINK